MAITPKKINFNNINEVKSGDGITTQHINAPLQASAYAQALATNKPSLEENGGEPSVSIQENTDGAPYLLFENLKGKDGKDGEVSLSKLEESQKVQDDKIALIESQSNKNLNQIKGLYSGLIQKEIFAIAEGVKISKETQTTGGSELSEFNIVDNSYATVKKISGDTVQNPYNNTLRNFNISGIKSVNSDLSLESVMNLPQTVELGKWDYIKDGKLYKHTKIEELKNRVFNAAYIQGQSTYRYHTRLYGGEGECIVSGLELLGNNDSDGYNNDNVGYYYSYYADGIGLFIKTNYATVEELNSYINDNQLLVAYRTKEPISITDLNFDNQYQVWDKGQETILSPNDSDGLNSFDYGSNPTIENDYYILVGAEE